MVQNSHNSAKVMEMYFSYEKLVINLSERVLRAPKKGSCFACSLSLSEINSRLWCSLFKKSKKVRACPQFQKSKNYRRHGYGKT